MALESREITAIRRRLKALKDGVLSGSARQNLPEYSDDPARSSARNLLHYQEFRRCDVRELQVDLAAWGVSRFDRLEPHVLPSIDAAIRLLTRGAGMEDSKSDWRIDLEGPAAILASRTRDLYGESDTGRDVRIMVTLPAEAADDYRLVKEMVSAGTNAVRINCAQGDRGSWGNMIHNVRRAEK